MLNVDIYQQPRKSTSHEIDYQENMQPVKASYSHDMLSTTEILDGPPPDYMNRSTASLFICFVWGIFAFQASNKTRKLNSMKAYDEALHYSRLAKEHNQSALACFIVCMFIFGVPAILSLATQGSISKYPSAREFFG